MEQEPRRVNTIIRHKQKFAIQSPTKVYVSLAISAYKFSVFFSVVFLLLPQSKLYVLLTFALLYFKRIPELTHSCTLHILCLTFRIDA